MEGALNKIVEFLTSDFSVSLLLSAVSFCAATLIAYARDKKLRQKDCELQKGLNEYEARLEEKAALREAVLEQLKKGHGISVERQVDAAERAWRGVLWLREVCAPCVDADRLLARKERAPDMVQKLVGLTSEEAMNRFVQSHESDRLEEVRPYLGEELWIDYLALRAFTGRCLYYYSNCLARGIDVVWAEDDGIKHIIGRVIKDETKRAALFNTDMGFLAAVQSEFENSAYISVRSILTGELASKESLSAISAISSLVDEELVKGRA